MQVTECLLDCNVAGHKSPQLPMTAFVYALNSNYVKPMQKKEGLAGLELLALFAAASMSLPTSPPFGPLKELDLAGNRTPVSSVAGTYSTTRPLSRFSCSCRGCQFLPPSTNLSQVTTAQRPKLISHEERQGKPRQGAYETQGSRTMVGP